MSNRRGFVHFRADQGLIDELQAIVERSKADGIPATISSVARIVMRKGLDQDPTQAETREVLSRVSQVTQTVMNRLKEETRGMLPTYLQEALDEIYNADRD